MSIPGAPSVAVQDMDAWKRSSPGSAVGVRCSCGAIQVLAYRGSLVISAESAGIHKIIKMGREAVCFNLTSEDEDLGLYRAKVTAKYMLGLR